MSRSERYAYLLELEAERRLRLAGIARGTAMEAAYREVAEALAAGANLLREEGARAWRIIPRSEIKRRLSLRPFGVG